MSKQPTSKPSKKYSMSELKKLLTYGEADKAKLSALSYGSEIELFRTSQDGQRYVAGNLLLKLLAELPSQKEVLSTVISYIENPSTISEDAQEEITRSKRIYSGLSIPDVYSSNRVQHWHRGRLLLLPGIKPLNNNAEDESTTSVLSGNWESPLDLSSSQPTPEQIMNWVLSSPWIFLLAQIVYTKEYWDAERTNTYFGLELDSKLISKFDSPPKIDTVIGLDNNDPIVCGSLGELILRVLAMLEIKLYPKPLTATELDAKLKPLIALLIKRKVWNCYQCKYQIDQNFSDSCYRIIGKRAFADASSLSSAIRDGCICWATEKLSRVSFKRSSFRL